MSQLLGKKSNLFFRKKVVKIVLIFLTIAIALNQWFYAQLFYRNLPFFKLFSSLFFWNLLVLLMWIFYKVFFFKRTRINIQIANLFRSVIIVASFTLPSILTTLMRDGIGYNTLEGLKFVSGILLAIAISDLLRDEKIFLFILILIIYLIQVGFGIAQLIIGISFNTPESFFTVGVLNRWWGLDSIWGTFSLSGKNSYGICLAFCTIIIGNFAMLTSRKRLQKFLFTTMPLAAICIYFSHSRTAIVCLSVFIVIRFWKMLKEGKLLLFMLSVVSVFSVFLIYIIFKTAPSWVFDSRSLIARLLQQKNALESMSSNIFFGNGYNSVLSNSINFSGSRALINSSNKFSGLSTDNFFLRRFLETGILGAVSFIYFLMHLLKLDGPKNLPKSQFQIEKKLLVKQIWMTLLFACLSFDYFSNQTNVCLFSLLLCYCVNMCDENSDRIKIRRAN